MTQKARKKIILLLMAVMISLTFLPLTATETRAVYIGDSLTVDSSGQYSYIDENGNLKYYNGGDVRNAYAIDDDGKKYTCLCLDHGIPYGEDYTVTGTEPDIWVLKWVYIYYKTPDDYEDQWVALQYHIWGGEGSVWGDWGDNENDLPAREAFDYMGAQMERWNNYPSLYPTDDELREMYDYCILECAGKQTQLCFAKAVPYVKKGSIAVSKVDANGDPLKGAKFEVRDASGNVVNISFLYGEEDEKGVLVTDDDGYAETGSVLDYGTYTVVEIEAPDGYSQTGMSETGETTQRSYHKNSKKQARAIDKLAPL